MCGNYPSMEGSVDTQPQFVATPMCGNYPSMEGSVDTHPNLWSLEKASTIAFLKFMLVLLFPPNRDVRKAAKGSTKKILLASRLSESILNEFSSYLSIVSEQVALLKTSDTKSVTDSQVPFLPPVEVLVKALVDIASALSASAPNAAFVLLLCCSHHPHIIGTRKKNYVWRRVQKCSQMLGLDLIGILNANVAEIWEGLMNSKHFEQESVINSLSALMPIIPGYIYDQFEKHFINFQDRIAHETLSEVDIQFTLSPYQRTSDSKSNPLSVDSFAFIFLVIERILLSPTKTILHDDVLKILLLHMDTILPRMRIKMLSVLYHVLEVEPDNCKVVSLLNDLCLDLGPNDVAPLSPIVKFLKMLRLPPAYGLLCITTHKSMLPELYEDLEAKQLQVHLLQQLERHC
ncbi:hypothetical protein PHJA_002793300 [Phtheirospermum japonicum]|uniref:Uncharacterized protein n=1 Tax=Phtheirospermum japonicum TaxID=374723 RepID=A0A830D774_9LAMI|nr:hypothetical protein PHJA_002793300 [Phtheirospermum japonicum]